MNDLEKNQNSTGSTSSLRDKLEKVGLRSTEKTAELRGTLTEVELGRGENKEIGDIWAETIKNLDNKIAAGDRNHEGNGRKAVPELAEVIKAVKTEQKMDRNPAGHLAEERAKVLDEIDRNRQFIREARKIEGNQDVAKNWELRLKKAETILAEIDKIAPYIETPGGKAMMYEWRQYVHALDKMTQAELKLSSDPSAMGAFSSAQSEALEIQGRINRTIEERGNPTFVSTEVSPLIRTEVVSLPEEVAPVMTPSEVISYPEKLVEIEKTDVGIYDKTNISRAMQRDMNVLFKDSKTGSMDSIQEVSAKTEVLSQEDAVSSFENEGGNIATEEVSTSIEAVAEKEPGAKFELISEEAKAGLNTEQLALVAKIEKNAKEVVVDIEERGIKARALEAIKNVGETWNKIPLRYKFAISGGLIATGAVMGASAVAPLFYVGAFLRGVGGVGLFASTDELLKKQSEKKRGAPRTSEEETRHIVLAAGLSFAVAALLPSVLRDHMINPLIEYMQTVHDPVNGGALFHTETPLAPVATTGVENLAVTGSYIEIAEAGDSVWKMTETQLQNHGLLRDLSPTQQAYIIDAIKDRIAQNPDTFGITDINKIEVGQGIDFTNALNDKEFIDNALASARGLSANELSNIENYTEDTGVRTLSTEELFTPPEVKEFIVPQTVEAVPMIETAAPQAILEEAAHQNANIEVGDIRGTFSYGPDGKVAGFTSTGALNYPQTLEAQKLFNDGWRGTVLSNETGLSSLNTSVVENRASTIYQYEQLLKALEEQGGGMSPEADYLREQVSNIITDTEKTYGDVFKNIDVTAGANHITESNSSVMPQQIVPNSPELAKYTNEYVRTAANDLFGSRGFLGFGVVDGTKSPHWLDFANRPVIEVTSAQQNIPSPTGSNVGIHDNSALRKMQDGIRIAMNKTGVTPTSGETVEKFLTRAAASTYGKIK